MCSGASSGLAIGLAVGVTTLLAIVSIVVIALACFYRARKLRHLRARYCVLTEAVQAATFLAALDVSPIDPPSNEPQNEGEGGAVSGAPPSYTAALYEASLPQQQVQYYVHVNLHCYNYACHINTQIYMLLSASESHIPTGICFYIVFSYPALL